MLCRSVGNIGRVNSPPDLRRSYGEVAHKIYLPKGAPDYAPDVWNRNRFSHNCYNYALRLRELGKSSPGSLLLEETDWFDFPEITVRNIKSKLEKDGLIEVTGFDFPDSHIITGFVHERFDYHFYSLDSNGYWSYKDGDDVVRTIARKIDFPEEELAVEFYDKFIGYYRVPENGIKYHPKLDQVNKRLSYS